MHKAAALASPDERRDINVEPDEGELKPWLEAMSTLLDGRSNEHGAIGKPCAEPQLPVAIAPGLLLGDKFCAWDTRKLVKVHGVTHILNCADASAKGPLNHSKLGLHYMQLNALDDAAYDIIGRHLLEAAAFIRSARRNAGACLIHCHAGVNRSAALMIAYLLLDERMPLLEAVHRCAEARGTILTNPSFRLQVARLASTEGLLKRRRPSLSQVKRRRPSAPQALLGQKSVPVPESMERDVVTTGKGVIIRGPKSRLAPWMPGDSGSWIGTSNPSSTVQVEQLAGCWLGCSHCGPIATRLTKMEDRDTYGSRHAPLCCTEWKYRRWGQTNRFDVVDTSCGEDFEVFTTGGRCVVEWIELQSSTGAEKQEREPCGWCCFSIRLRLC